MSNISTVSSITYRVEYGTEGETVPFVDDSRLLTTFHMISSVLNDNSIYVEIEEEDYECELTIVRPGKDIAILTLKGEAASHEYGSLFNISIEAKTYFRFWNYPSTLIGQTVGQSVKIRMDETYTALSGGSNAYAVSEDKKHLTEYTGFPGSPVYTDGNKMIGIATNILDNHIGSISIKSVEAELKAQGVPAESDHIKSQEIAYSRREYVEKLHKQIALARDRYKPGLDVPNQSFETLFANLRGIRSLEKHKEMLRTGKQVFLSLQKTNSTLFVTPPDKTLSGLDYSIGMQRDVERLKSDMPDQRTVKAAPRKELLFWKQIHENVLYVVNK